MDIFNTTIGGPTDILLSFSSLCFYKAVLSNIALENVFILHFLSLKIEFEEDITVRLIYNISLFKEQRIQKERTAIVFLLRKLSLDACNALDILMASDWFYIPRSVFHILSDRSFHIF